MKQAVITGTSSGIGLEIARLLLEEGYHIYGISRTSSALKSHPEFTEFLCDLTDDAARRQRIQELMALPDFSCDLLINNAGCGYYGLHENLSEAAILEMVTTNLTLPMYLCRTFLPTLKKNGGTIVNLSSYTASHVNTHGAAYGATKAALSSFSESIYEEARKHKVRMIIAEPEMTATNLYRNADFCAETEEGCSLSATEVARIIVQALHNSVGYQKLTLQPQYRRIHRKTPEGRSTD